MQWFRLYDDVLDDPKVQQLAPDLFKHWINLLCLANKSADRGTLPAMSDIAFRLRVSIAEADSIIADLSMAGLIEESDETLAPHNWQGRQKRSDDSAPRVAKHRSNGQPSEPVTLPSRYRNALDTDTEIDTEQTAPPISPPRSETAANGKPPPAVDYAETLNGNVPVLVEKYSALDPLLNETWMLGFLGRAGPQFGPLPSKKLMTAFGLAHRQIERRIRAPDETPIRSPRKFAEKVIRDQLQEQRA